MYELILIEIIAVPAERSRGRHNPRVVKRKMSSFPTKARAAPPPGQVFHYEEHIRIVAPVSPPADQGSPPIAAPKNGPKRQQPRKASAPAGQRPFWLEHVRSWRASSLSRTAYCERHSLSPGAFITGWLARARASERCAHSLKSLKSAVLGLARIIHETCSVVA
jgi:hypothetical protein